MDAGLAALAVLHAALFAAVLQRTMVLRPFWDMYSWIDDWLRSGAQGGLAYLWAPHNEHHLVLIRLLTALDVGVFGTSGLPFVAAGTGAMAATALLVLVELRRGCRPGSALRALAWIGPMLLLTPAASVDCSIPINTVYPMALLFLVLGLVLVIQEDGRAAATGARRMAAVASAVLASWGNGVGLVAWPVLLWSAWRGGAPRRWLAVLACFGAGYGAFYLSGLPQHGFGGPGRLFTWSHVLKTLDYLLAYLGLPLSRAPGLGLPARVLGAVLLVAGAAAVGRDAGRAGAGTRLHRIGIGLVVMGLAAAGLAAVGRADLEAEVKVPVRYAILVAPLHIGLLALALPWLAGFARTPRRGAVVLGGASGLAGVALVLQVLGGRSAAAASDAISATLSRYEAGLRDPGMERTVFPDLAEADRIRAELLRLRPGR